MSGGGRPDRIVKVGAADNPFAVAPEADRLRWLAGRVPVPEVLAMEHRDGWDVLVTTALDGVDAADAARTLDGDVLVMLLADGLRTVHDRLPVGDCPFVNSVDAMVERKRIAVAAGLCDPASVQEQVGCTPEEAWAELAAWRPREDDLVVTHGDYSPGNVMIDGERCGGFVDWDWAGVGDRHWDLTVAMVGAERVIGPDAGDAFVDRYGREAFDPAKHRFFRLLDALA